MRIDLPQCNLKTCRHCFDGNCIDTDKYEQCSYTIVINNCKRLLNMLSLTGKVFENWMKDYEALKYDNFTKYRIKTVKVNNDERTGYSEFKTRKEME